MTKKTTIHDLKLKMVLFIALLLGAVLFSLSLSINYLKAHQDSNEPVYYSCNSYGQTYFIYFKDNQVQPKKVEAKPCDLITFINQDKFRLIAFGRHDKHAEYNGIYEQPMATGDSFTITLDKSGEYVFHDHYQEYIGGSFSVIDTTK